MGNTKPYLRAITFAGVLILVSGLMLGLFQEARAVSFETNANDMTSNTETVHVVVIVPDNQRLPVESVDAVIEETTTATKSSPTKVSHKRCAGLKTCTSSQLTDVSISHDKKDAITQIAFDKVTANGGDVTSSSASLCSNEAGGYCFITHPGYGYDNAGGYGYDAPGSLGNEDKSVTTGYGYGYDGATARLHFNVTVSASTLNNGHYWLTFIVNTGSGTIGQLSSADDHFQVSLSTGGGGGTVGDGGTGGTPAKKVNAGVTFDGKANQVIKVTGNLPSGVLNIQITLAKDCDNCKVRVTRSVSGPAGASNPADDGFDPLYYLELSVLDSDGNVIDGAVSSGFVQFEVTQDELPGNRRASQVLLLRHTNPWVPLDTSLTSDADADPLEFNATLTGFSNFAVVTDSRAPSISNGAPTGVIQQVTPSISADFSDNRAVDTSTFELTIDGQTHDDTTGDLTVTSSGFTYVPGTALDTSEHMVEASLEDISGNTGTESWTFTVTTPECPEPPRIVSVTPADGTTDVGLGSTITATIEEGSCPIVSTTLTINGEDVDATLTAGTVTATLPDTVGYEEAVDAQLVVEDDSGNKASKSWSYTTEQQPGEEPPEEPPEDDGGIPGWVWVVIILLVVIAAGAGWYYYEEQK